MRTSTLKSRKRFLFTKITYHLIRSSLKKSTALSAELICRTRIDREQHMCLGKPLNKRKVYDRTLFTEINVALSPFGQWRYGNLSGCPLNRKGERKSGGSKKNTTKIERNLNYFFYYERYGNDDCFEEKVPVL